MFNMCLIFQCNYQLDVLDILNCFDCDKINKQLHWRLQLIPMNIES